MQLSNKVVDAIKIISKGECNFFKSVNTVAKICEGSDDLTHQAIEKEILGEIWS